MCGRFALGYDGDEIVAYFAAQQEPEEAPPQSDEEDSGGEEEEHRAESFEVEEQPVASGSGAGAGAGRRRVHWANEEAKGGYRPRYNVAPQSRSVVIHKLPGSDEYVLELMKWGLVPSWTKRPPEKPLSTFNAREESVASGSGMWAGLRGKHRCVVVAQGFYEWLAKGKEKIPHFTKPTQQPLMVMAGLWDEAKYEDGSDPFKSFTIITTSSNKQLSFLHDRMPVILSTPSDISLWLSDAPWSPKIQSLLRPFEGKLECYPVLKEVGKVQNDSSEFIKPISERKGNIASMFAKQAASSPSKPLPSSSKPAGSTSKLSDRASDTATSSKRSRSRDSSVEIVEEAASAPKKLKSSSSSTGGKKV